MDALAPSYTGTPFSYRASYFSAVEYKKVTAWEVEYHYG